MNSDDSHCDGEMLSGHAIIGGFGVPGRAVAEWLGAHNIPFCVIELNPQTVHRCAHVGVHIIEGDVCDEQVLRRAGIDRAALFAVTVPADPAVLEAVRVARRLNPTLRIIARCRFISSGMQAHRNGASEVVIEEQVVAKEFTARLEADPVPAPPAHVSQV